MQISRVPALMAPTAAKRSALARLLAELDPAHPPRLVGLERVLSDPSTELLVAVRTGGPWPEIRDEDYVGMLTLGYRTTLTRLSAHAAHVGVDPAHRRAGLGARLVREALEVAAAAGASRVDLTSSSRRAAAQELYRSLGFTQRDTVNWRRQLA